MDIKLLIEKIKTLPNCKVYSQKKLPIPNQKHILPEDVKEFYELCGGISLFEGESYAINIVPPEKFILDNPIIIGELCEEDITSEWYIIGEDCNGDYITIDLNSKRLGKCYDSFWDRHGIVGECPVIARNFTELLSNLIKSKGYSWYWLEESFEPLGDAYDNIELD
ncbi:SMI1/KNR4 family protein [Clostridium sp. Marseille-Q2269]|uniref:SMI1/KNR4 family protein n=1 Tax=Clostridium sp. Marseille-Q2269 TaxID=2942205 RepID=UPI0020747BDE|nr:SMI1/KNR4 family protein [Clostridium sp. Marseille-Q2269]